MRLTRLSTRRVALGAALFLMPALLPAQTAVAPEPPEAAIAAAQPAPPPPPEPPDPMHLMLSGSTYLGVGVRDIDAERAKALKLKEEYGVEVTAVEADSPASKAGLKPGDAVLEYNGQRIEGTQQFIRFVRETPAGRTVRLTVARDGNPQTLSAVIGTRKGRAFTFIAPEVRAFKFEMPHIELPDIPKAMMSWRSAMLGVEAESLGGSQLAAFFGVKEGVLVRSVMKGTPAEKAGLRAGDVILKVDGQKVAAPRDITATLRSARAASKKSIPVTLVREKKEMTLHVTMEDDTPGRPAAPRGQRVTVKQLEL